MKTYGERFESVNIKIDHLKRKRRAKRAIISGVCLMLVAAIALALFWPYNTAAPSVRQYAKSPYYSLIQRIKEIDSLQLFSFVAFQELLIPMMATFGAAGLFVGIVGSWTSIRKFMNV